MRTLKITPLIVCCLLISISLCVVSCGGDDDKVISGLYYYNSAPDGNSRTAYYFKNGNTVDVYGVMSNNPNAKWHGERGVAFPLRSGWYYSEGNKHTYSYHIVGDMVIVGTDRVMTISGNTLIYDDMGVVLYKWD